MEEPRPWADLHEELLDRVFSHLTSFVDRACSSAVCKSWRGAATSAHRQARALLPWVLRPSTAGTSYLRVFTEGIAYKPVVPDHARRARFCGSTTSGWFVVALDQWRGFELLNLHTRERIPLPDGLMLPVPDPVDLPLTLHPSPLAILAACVTMEPTNEYFYAVAAIVASRQPMAVFWCPGLDYWLPVEPEEGDPLGDEMMREELEDVISYKTDHHEGFYFLTSQERLIQLEMDYVGKDEEEEEDEEEEDEIPHLFQRVTFHKFPHHCMSWPPQVGLVTAGRYLVESDGILLMVKRFVCPGHGTVAFRVFRLRWDNGNPYWQRSDDALAGHLVFLRRGCSRAIPTGRCRRPGFIYFLDDAEGFNDPNHDHNLLHTIVNTEKLYRCTDAGWCNYSTQEVRKPWPQGPPADCSPWIWLYRS